MLCKKLDLFADRGYFKGEEILDCEQADITTYLPKPQTSNNIAKGLFSKRDFIYNQTMTSINVLRESV